MELFIHEIKLSKKMLIIWTTAIAFMLAICVFIFPSMKSQMDNFSDMMSQMGDFSNAFGLSKLNMGTLIGYYSIECGNVLGLGGALFASLLGASIISKEEREHTAEFLLTNPVNRSSVLTSKLLAVVFNIVVMNVVIFIVSMISILCIGDSIPFKEMLLLHLAYLILQLELGIITYGISSFIKSNSIGIGLGMALLLYFINIMSNITDSAKFLKYLTPFAYAEAADIISSNSLDMKYIGIGIGVSIFFGVLAYFIYTKRDIKA